MNIWGKGSESINPCFLYPALVGDEWSTSRSGLTFGERAPATIGEGIGLTLEPVWTTWRNKIFLPYWDSNPGPFVAYPEDSRCTDRTTLSSLNALVQWTIAGYIYIYVLELKWVVFFLQKNTERNMNISASDSDRNVEIHSLKLS
jgi:hypothetical protein